MREPRVNYYHFMRRDHLINYKNETKKKFKKIMNKTKNMKCRLNEGFNKKKQKTKKNYVAVMRLFCVLV